MYDFSDVEPQQSTDLIPDGTFAKVIMTIRPGGVDGQTEIDRGLLKASTTPGSDVLSLDGELTVTEGKFVRRKFWHAFTVSGGKVDEKGASIGWNISKRTFRAMIDSALGPRSRRQQRGGEGQAAAARSCRPRRHHLRRQDHGRAEHRSPLPGQEQARSAGAAQREGVARGHERRGRGAEPLAATFGQQRRRSAARTEARLGPAAGQARAAGRAAAWQRPATAPLGQDAGNGQPAKPAGPAWLNQ